MDKQYAATESWMRVLTKLPCCQYRWEQACEVLAEALLTAIENADGQLECRPWLKAGFQMLEINPHQSDVGSWMNYSDEEKLLCTKKLHHVMSRLYAWSRKTPVGKLTKRIKEVFAGEPDEGLISSLLFCEFSYERPEFQSEFLHRFTEALPPENAAQVYLESPLNEQELTLIATACRSVGNEDLAYEMFIDAIKERTANVNSLTANLMSANDGNRNYLGCKRYTLLSEEPLRPLMFLYRPVAFAHFSDGLKRLRRGRRGDHDLCSILEADKKAWISLFRAIAELTKGNRIANRLESLFTSFHDEFHFRITSEKYEQEGRDMWLGKLQEFQSMLIDAGGIISEADHKLAETTNEMLSRPHASLVIMRVNEQNELLDHIHDLSYRPHGALLGLKPLVELLGIDEFRRVQKIWISTAKVEDEAQKRMCNVFADPAHDCLGDMSSEDVGLTLSKSWTHWIFFNLRDALANYNGLCLDYTPLSTAILFAHGGPVSPLIDLTWLLKTGGCTVSRQSLEEASYLGNLIVKSLSRLADNKEMHEAFFEARQLMSQAMNTIQMVGEGIHEVDGADSERVKDLGVKLLETADQLSNVFDTIAKEFYVQEQKAHAKNSESVNPIPAVVVGYSASGREQAKAIVNSQTPEMKLMGRGSLAKLFNAHINTVDNWLKGKPSPEGFHEALKNRDWDKMLLCAVSYRKSRGEGDVYNLKTIVHGISDEQMVKLGAKLPDGRCGSPQ